MRLNRFLTRSLRRPFGTVAPFPLLPGLCVLAVLLFPIGAEAAEITARLTPETFSLEHPAALDIIVSGQQTAHIELPEVDGLVFHSRGRSRQFQMINGAVSSSTTHAYHVQALRPGTYTIPAITVSIGGTSHRTQPLTCAVTGNGSPQSGLTRPDESNGNETQSLAFIRLLPEKNRAYLNEVVPTTIKAYFQSGIKVNLNTLPTLKSDSVLLDSLGDEPRQQQETVDAVPYTVVIWESALTGIKEGRHDLILEAAVTLLVRSRQQRLPPGLGGRFFDDTFGRFEHRPLTVSSSVRPFTVEPLPDDGRPEGFSGAVGSFTLKLTAHPETVEIGEPITLTMTVAGTGNFDTVVAPGLDNRNGLKTYAPAATFHRTAAAYQGEKIFEQAVVVTDGAFRGIPSIAFSFFDPREQRYRTLRSAPIPLTVAGDPAGLSAVPLEQAVQARQQATVVEGPATHHALAPVKLASTAATPTFTPLFLRPWFVATLTAILLAIFGVTALRLRTALLQARPERLHALVISRARRQTLPLLEEAAGTARNEDYLLAVQQLLRGFFAVLWQINAGSLTTADISRRLGVDSPASTLFFRADRQAYGATALSDQERRELHDAITRFVSTCS